VRGSMVRWFRPKALRRRVVAFMVLLGGVTHRMHGVEELVRRCSAGRR
jgi:hypothetical protein